MLMEWLIAQSAFVLPLLVGGLAVAWLLPSRLPKPPIVGYALGIIAVALLYSGFIPAETSDLRNLLFTVFSLTAVLAATLTVTSGNPVYSALWFAVATLGVCGLFMLNSAPFLAAATVIVYAGAIIVTFAFVIMLAQQGGSAGYDRRAEHPILVTLFSMVMLGSLLFGLQETRRLATAGGSEAGSMRPAVLVTSAAGLGFDRAPNPFSVSQENDLGSLRGVGRSLFTDYLYASELAGTVLLIATIGAIAVAPRRSRGTL
jgi:NADH-quinone oxidoreductase subunit J